MLCNCVTVASTNASNKLIKLGSKFDTQISIFDGDIPPIEVEATNKNLTDNVSTPGKVLIAT